MNPSFATTPVPFDPPDSPADLYGILSSADRTRLVKLHQLGGQTYSASIDDSLKTMGLLVTKSSKSYVSPAGCALAVHAWYQGVTP